MNKRLLSLIFAVVMVLSLCISPISAADASVSKSLTGYIVCTESDINMSGIEIKVYSAVKIEEDETGYALFEETYAFSVYTDEKGEFKFNKPSEYCSMSINLSTLPYEMGVSKHTQFYSPDKSNDKIYISTVKSIQTALVDGEISVSLFNINKEEIYANYTINKEEMEAPKLEELLELNELSLKGIVTTSSVKYEYTESIDISDYSIVNKIDLLYYLGIYSEDEQILAYCDILTSKDESLKKSISSDVYNLLIEYRSSIDDNSITAQNIDLLMALNSYPNPPDYITL